MLVSKIQKQIKSIYSELFNCVSYRFLVEKEARGMKSEPNLFNIIDKCENIKSKLFVSEEIMYKSYVFYLYYLSLLKWEDFNPEIDLRINFFWDWVQESSVNFKKTKFCSWVYRIKKDQIIELVLSLS